MRFFFLLFCFTGLNSFAQEVQDVKKYLHTIQSTDINRNDLSDLEAIGKAIGKAQIVLLGEQDHGDADAMEMKARIVRYLHEKKGFNILAFESDMFSIRDLSVHKKNEWYTDSLRNVVSPYWAKTKATEPLWQYLRKSFNSDKPLEITGFDIGLRTAYARRNFLSAFSNALKKVNTINEKVSGTMQKLLDGQPSSSFDEDEKKTFFSVVEKATAALKVNDPAYGIFQTAKNKALYTWTRNSREAGMTRNLTWLINHVYKGQKIIVWTASYHAVKDIYAVTENSERSEYFRNAVNKDTLETMLQMMIRDVKAPIYSLSTIAVSGNYTPTAWTSLTNKADSIVTPENGIEKYIETLPCDLSFLNLRALPASHPLQQPLPMIPLLHKIAYNAVWTKVYDGLIFIKNMKALQ